MEPAGRGKGHKDMSVPKTETGLVCGDVCRPQSWAQTGHGAGSSAPPCPGGRSHGQTLCSPHHHWGWHHQTLPLPCLTRQVWGVGGEWLGTQIRPNCV